MRVKPARPWLPVILTMFASPALIAGGVAPERIVAGNTVTSYRDPAIQITLPSAAQYVGAARWDLHDVSDCELHLFVEADEHKVVKSLYWIQFEAFLPTKPNAYHRYPFTERLVHGEFEFDVRARFGPTSEAPKQGSDLERVNMLLEKNGFRVPAEMMNVRLVHLPDVERRKELMVIYSEDLAPTGSNFQELSATSGNARWMKIKSELIERALSKIQLAKLTRALPPQ